MQSVSQFTVLSLKSQPSFSKTKPAPSKSSNLLIGMYEEASRVKDLLELFESNFKRKHAGSIQLPGIVETVQDVQELSGQVNLLAKELCDGLCLQRMDDLSDEVKALADLQLLVIEYLLRRLKTSAAVDQEQRKAGAPERRVCQVCLNDLQLTKLRQLQVKNVRAVATKKEYLEYLISREKQLYAEMEREKNKFEIECNEEELSNFLTRKLDLYIESVDKVLEDRAIVEHRVYSEAEKVLRDIVRLYAERSDFQLPESEFLESSKQFKNASLIVAKANSDMLSKAKEQYSSSFFEFCLRTSERISRNTLARLRLSMKDASVQTLDPKSKENKSLIQLKAESAAREVDSQKSRIADYEKQKAVSIAAFKDYEKTIFDQKNRLAQLQRALQLKLSEMAALRKEHEQSVKTSKDENEEEKNFLKERVKFYRAALQKEERQNEYLKRLKEKESVSRVTQTRPVQRFQVGIQSEDRMAPMLDYLKQRVAKYETMLKQLGKEKEVRQEQENEQRAIRDIEEQAKLKAAAECQVKMVSVAAIEEVAEVQPERGRSKRLKNEAIRELDQQQQQTLKSLDKKQESPGEQGVDSKSEASLSSGRGIDSRRESGTSQNQRRASQVSRQSKWKQSRYSNKTSSKLQASQRKSNFSRAQKSERSEQRRQSTIFQSSSAVSKYRRSEMQRQHSIWPSEKSVSKDQQKEAADKSHVSRKQLQDLYSNRLISEVMLQSQKYQEVDSRKISKVNESLSKEIGVRPAQSQTQEQKAAKAASVETVEDTIISNFAKQLQRVLSIDTKEISQEVLSIIYRLSNQFMKQKQQQIRSARESQKRLPRQSSVAIRSSSQIKNDDLPPLQSQKEKDKQTQTQTQKIKVVKKKINAAQLKIKEWKPSHTFGVMRQTNVSSILNIQEREERGQTPPPDKPAIKARPKEKSKIQMIEQEVEQDQQLRFGGRTLPVQQRRSSSKHEPKTAQKRGVRYKLSHLLSDLDLFGGISDSYAYQRLVQNAQSVRVECSAEEQATVSKMFQHLEGMRKRNLKLYNSVKLFLRYPYQVCSSKQEIVDHTGPISHHLLRIMMNFIFKKHKACSPCPHLGRFFSKLGYVGGLFAH